MTKELKILSSFVLNNESRGMCSRLLFEFDSTKRSCLQIVTDQHIQYVRLSYFFFYLPIEGNDWSFPRTNPFSFLWQSLPMYVMIKRICDDTRNTLIISKCSYAFLKDEEKPTVFYRDRAILRCELYHVERKYFLAFFNKDHHGFSALHWIADFSIYSFTHWRIYRVCIHICKISCARRMW